MSSPTMAVAFSCKRVSVGEMAKSGLWLKLILAGILPVFVSTVVYPIGHLGSERSVHEAPNWVYNDDEGGSEVGCGD